MPADPMKRRRDERGMSISVLAAVGIPAFILALGIGIDFAGQTSAESEALAVAGEAARAGVQAVQVGHGGVSIVGRQARHAAESHASASGYTGSAVVASDGVAVTIRGSYQTRFLGLIGIHSLRYEATGRALYAEAVDDEEA